MKHLAVYFYKKGALTGFGSCEVYFRCYPPTTEDVQDTQKKIAAKFSLDEALIVNWLPLSEDTPEENQQT